MSGKIFAVVGTILKNAHGWFDLPGKGVIFIYLKVKRTGTKVIQNSAYVCLSHTSRSAYSVYTGVLISS